MSARSLTPLILASLFLAGTVSTALAQESPPPKPRPSGCERGETPTA